MERKLKRRIAVAGSVLVVLGGAGGAYAVTSGSGNDRDAYLNDIAGRLHVTRPQLDAALKGAFGDRLDAAVKAGKLTQAEADAIKKRAEQQGGAPLLGGGFRGGRGPGPLGGPGPRRFPGPFGGAVGAGATAAAKFLGLTGAQLRQQLQSGKSLAQIAGDKNKSVGDLEQAIKDGVKAQLDSLVTSKKITKAQEDDALSKLNAHLDDLVKATPPKGKLLHRGKKGAGPALRHGSFRGPGARGAGGPPGGGPGPGGPPFF